MNEPIALSCPIPIGRHPNILLAHGGGGRLTQELIEGIFLPAFSNPALNARHDSAVFDLKGGRLAFTTDSYVISPLFFPGGDIGSLSVYGTVNDLAMAGARPLWLSAAFILEEGLPIETLWTVVQSMKRAAERVGARIVTGDTKVVDKGKGDSLFVNTAGIGVIEHPLTISPQSVKKGDLIILNGDIGRHGIAVMAQREGLEFETEIRSDSAPLWDLVSLLLSEGIRIHCLRDLTRGGLAGALNEIAQAAQVRFILDESSIPVREDVQGACEILGLDPLYVANEGRLVAIVDPGDGKRALNLMISHPLGAEAGIVGNATEDSSPLVTLKSKICGSRIVDMPAGEQLPRIC